MNYKSFLDTKALICHPVGFDVADSDLNLNLFPFQRDLTKWGIRKGRAALFATTGLGKTIMQLAWAEAAVRRSIVFAPLAVAQQTVNEGAKWGIPVTYARSMVDSPKFGITITNYEMLEHFDMREYQAVVIDESSCLKDFESKRKKLLVDRCSVVPMRLCCTATPAPNDIAEIANHAEFLGIMTRTEMLATFFVHDENGWRLKGYAREAFYKWLASWGMSLMKPSDLGYSDDGYILPELIIKPIFVGTSYAPNGQLFASSLKGITERAAVRKDTIDERVRAATEVINNEPDEQWIIWTGLNDEADKMAKAVGAANVHGAMDLDAKANSLMSFAAGGINRMVTKTKIAGFGLNLQSCARMVFVGLSDSYEQYFQAIRRCWRFGQTRPVHVYIVLTDLESEIYYNVLRKQQEAEAMTQELIKNVAEFERAEVHAITQQFDYKADQKMKLPKFIKENSCNLRQVS